MYIRAEKKIAETKGNALILFILFNSILTTSINLYLNVLSSLIKFNEIRARLVILALIISGYIGRIF